MKVAEWRSFYYDPLKKCSMELSKNASLQNDLGIYIKKLIRRFGFGTLSLVLGNTAKKRYRVIVQQNEKIAEWAMRTSDYMQPKGLESENRNFYELQLKVDDKKLLQLIEAYHSAKEEYDEQHHIA